MEDVKFEASVGDERASILASLCNELRCCRNILREIDSSLDEIGKLKGDRWLRDGKARALKAHQKRRKRELKKDHKEHDEDGEEQSTVHTNNKKLTPVLGQVEILTNEEENMSVDELENVIINLKLESDDLKDEINKLVNRVRSHTPDRPSDFICLFCDDKDVTENHRVVVRSESEEPKENEEAVHIEDVSIQKDARKPQKRKADGPPPIIFPQEMGMDLCRTMLDEMEMQPTVGPFLDPVDTDLVPGYKEAIPHPIDLSTIRNKVDKQNYTSPDEFANDVELMFVNCRTFNEDNSPVGVAGQSLFKFFQKRWKQVKYNYSKRLRRMQAAQASN